LALLRLYLDREGYTRIPCPTCNRPLLLGAERMGRWVVGWERGLRIRPGAPATLVCSGYACDYVEPVEIARRPDEATRFDGYGAAWQFRQQAAACNRTMHEMAGEIQQLTQRLKAGGHPKLHSAIKFWREQLRQLRSQLSYDVRSSFQEKREVHCEGRDIDETGVITEIRDNGLMLTRKADGTSVFVAASQLRHVYQLWEELMNPESQAYRFNFAPSRRKEFGCHEQFVARDFVVVSGYVLALSNVSTSGICTVATGSVEAARALGLWSDDGRCFRGELPIGLVERRYMALQYAYVKGHKLYVRAHTTHPDVLVCTTSKLDIAQALQMPRKDCFWDGSRQLEWEQYYHRSELDRLETVHVLRPLRRERQKHKAR
jgi:hypothetical protein